MDHALISSLRFEHRLPGLLPAAGPIREPGAAADATAALSRGGPQSTGAWVAQLQTLCIDALQPYLNGPGEAAAGTAMTLALHLPATAPGPISVLGWVQRLDQAEVTFRVDARVGQQTVCEGSLLFHISS